MSDGDEQLSRGHYKALGLSTRAYRRLLWAYPEEFRREYAEEMVRYFWDLCSDSLRAGGLPALMVTWMRTLLELVRSARAERKRSVPDVDDLHAPSAAFISLLVWPGTGQAYNKRPVKSLAHALFAPLLFIFIGWVLESWFGLALLAVLWVYSAADALVDARRIKAAQRGS